MKAITKSESRQIIRNNVINYFGKKEEFKNLLIEEVFEEGEDVIDGVNIADIQEQNYIKDNKELFEDIDSDDEDGLSIRYNKIREQKLKEYYNCIKTYLRIISNQDALPNIIAQEFILKYKKLNIKEQSCFVTINYFIINYSNKIVCLQTILL